MLLVKSLVLVLSLLSLLPSLHGRVHHHGSRVGPAFTSPLPRVSPSSASVSKTILQWSRQLRTCDASADMDIDMLGTSRVIYAIGDRDPASDTSVPFHSTMGVRNVNLMDSPITPPMPADARTHSVMSRSFPIDKDTLTAPSTYYHCQGFVRNFTAKEQIVKVTPQVDFYHSSLVHHMLLFRCDTPLSEKDLAWAGNCYGTTTPKTVSACDQVHVLAGWAVGGGEFYYPPDVGFPIGPGATYMMLQIHYHNPHGVTFNDSAGFILTTTPTLRRYDAGTIVLHHALPTLTIPPRQLAYNVSIYAPQQCFSSIPDSGLHVFGSMLHTHETGVQVRTQHFREGVELPNLDANLHYDFNFQQVASFNPDRYPVLRAGDSLKLTCTYNTMDRVNATKGGISTKDEMCMDYVWYYPAAYSKNPLTIVTASRTPTQPANNFTTVCQYVSGLPGLYNNFREPAVTTPLPVPSCAVAAGRSRTWGTPPAMNGTTGTMAISAEQWAKDKAGYSRSAVLDNEGRFQLFWNVAMDADGANGVISFAAEVETTGWVGMGLSASGAMVDSDSVIGWVKTVEEGAPQVQVDLTDRWNSVYAQPKIDVSQDVFDVRGVQAALPPTPPQISPIYYNVTSTPDPLPPIAPSSSTGSDVVVVSSSAGSSSAGSSGAGSSGGDVLPDSADSGSSALGVLLGTIAIVLTVVLGIVLAMYFVRTRRALSDPTHSSTSAALNVGERTGLQAKLLSNSDGI